MSLEEGVKHRLESGKVAICSIPKSLAVPNVMLEIRDRFSLIVFLTVADPTANGIEDFDEDNSIWLTVDASRYNNLMDLLDELEEIDEN